MIYLYLAPAAISDLLKKYIPYYIVAIGLGFGIAGMCIGVQKYGAIYFLSLVPGAILIASYFVTEGKIGLGDGISVMILGAVEGYRICFISTILGEMLLFLACLILVILKKVNLKSTIPFIPFLAVARILVDFLPI